MPFDTEAFQKLRESLWNTTQELEDLIDEAVDEIMDDVPVEVSPTPAPTSYPDAENAADELRKRTSDLNRVDFLKAFRTTVEPLLCHMEGKLNYAYAKIDSLANPRRAITAMARDIAGLRLILSRVVDVVGRMVDPKQGPSFRKQLLKWLTENDRSFIIEDLLAAGGFGNVPKEFTPDEPLVALAYAEFDERDFIDQKISLPVVRRLIAMAVDEARSDMKPQFDRDSIQRILDRRHMVEFVGAEGLDVLGFLSVISDMILFGQIVKAPPKVEPDKAKQARKPRRKPVSKKRQPKRKTRKK